VDGLNGSLFSHCLLHSLSTTLGLGIPEVTHQNPRSSGRYGQMITIVIVNALLH
jgi:hypothetical protein